MRSNQRHTCTRLLLCAASRPSFTQVSKTGAVARAAATSRAVTTGPQRKVFSPRARTSGSTFPAKVSNDSRCSRSSILSINFVRSDCRDPPPRSSECVGSACRHAVTSSETLSNRFRAVAARQSATHSGQRFGDTIVITGQPTLSLILRPKPVPKPERNRSLSIKKNFRALIELFAVHASMRACGHFRQRVAGLLSGFVCAQSPSSDKRQTQVEHRNACFVRRSRHRRAWFRCAA